MNSTEKIFHIDQQNIKALKDKGIEYLKNHIKEEKVCNKNLFNNMLIKIEVKEFSEEFISYYTDQKILERILICRENDIDKSLELYKPYIDWLCKIRPDIFDEKEIYNSGKSGKVMIHGKDKEDRPIIIGQPRYHYPDECPIENTFKLQYYMINKLLKKAKNSKDGKFLAIIDTNEISLSNLDRKILWNKYIINSLQEIYFEKIHAIYVINTGVVFRTIHAIVSPFMNQKLKSIFNVISDIENLKDYISEENILKIHGGTSNYEFEFPQIDIDK